MIGLFPRLLLVCLLGLPCLLALPWQAVLAETPNYGGIKQNGAVAGMLVLRNGNVLSGHVIRLKDYYQVEMPKGQLQVPVVQVELFCHNLDEAYAERRRVRTGSTADSHLELANWCMRLRLYEHAATELRAARAIDSGHRKLAMLERRLQHAQQKAQQPRASQRNAAPAKLATNETKPQPQGEPKLARRVPQQVRVMFVRQIQPMLVKSCAATGCHQSGSSRTWQLNRLAVDGAGHPQATRNNLTSTLAQIDWQAPSESALLGLAKTNHGALGGDSSEPLSLRQFQMLRGWLQQLAASSQAVDLAEAYAKPTVENQSPKAGLKIPTSFQAGHKVRIASAAGADPFDPDVFNRRRRRPHHQDPHQPSVPIRPAQQTDSAPQKLPSTPPSVPVPTDQ